MKTALVTGASRGIGLAIARELGVNGYQVAVMATRGESFYPESTRTLRDAGISYAWYAGDIGSPRTESVLSGKQQNTSGKSMCWSTMRGWRPR